MSSNGNVTGTGTNSSPLPNTDNKQTWQALFFEALTLSLVLGLVSQIDPFGLKSAIEHQSESVFMRFIGGPWYDKDIGPRAPITVILVDDKYLDFHDAHWPLSYREQDKLLTDIFLLNPKAVFLDFLYRYKHDSNGELGKFVQTLQSFNKDVPILLPHLIKGGNRGGTCNPAQVFQPFDLAYKESIIEEIRELRLPAAYIGWSGCGSRYPLYVGGNPGMPTPAYAMYRAYCEKRGIVSNDCARVLENDPGSAFSEPMVVRWGTGVSADQYQVMIENQVKCTRLGADGEGHFSYLFSQLFASLEGALSSNLERGKREDCAYIDTLHATWFEGSSESRRKLLERFVTDRYVFVGAQIEGTQDYIENPVNGQLPGVYLFAMALDNLIHYGSDYYKEMSWLATTVVEIVLLFAILLIISILWGKIKHVWWALVLIKIVVPLLLGFIGVSLLWWWGKYAPMDWLSVAVLAFIASPVVWRDCVKSVVKQVMESRTGK